jgi:hypothetical protein
MANLETEPSSDETRQVPALLRFPGQRDLLQHDARRGLGRGRPEPKPKPPLAGHALLDATALQRQGCLRCGCVALYFPSTGINNLSRCLDSRLSN